MRLERKAKYIFAVGGGKGGVGKSVFSISFASVLAGLGKKVVLVDFDLGGANLHTYLGIMGKTKTLAHFIQKKVASLSEILVDTNVNNLKLISGAQYVPGMANPASWMKVKLIRHVQALDVDFVILDLGAGTHFSTLDFFDASDRGFIVTVPEPAAVMNAYRFIKGSLFRKLQAVFKNHPTLSSIIDALSEKEEYEGSILLKWFDQKVQEVDPNVHPLVKEISEGFAPSLVINKMPENPKDNFVDKLLKHCMANYNVRLNYLGSLPDIREIGDYQLNIPQFLTSWPGTAYLSSLNLIIRKVLAQLKDIEDLHDKLDVKAGFSDDDIEKISQLLDQLDNSFFEGTGRRVWKLRLYFKPVQVVNYLVSKGLKREVFYK